MKQLKNIVTTHDGKYKSLIPARCKYHLPTIISSLLNKSHTKNKKQKIDRQQTGRQTDRQIDRQAGRQADSRQTDRQTADRQTDK